MAETWRFNQGFDFLTHRSLRTSRRATGCSSLHQCVLYCSILLPSLGVESWFQTYLSVFGPFSIKNQVICFVGSIYLDRYLRYPWVIPALSRKKQSTATTGSCPGISMSWLGEQTMNLFVPRSLEFGWFWWMSFCSAICSGKRCSSHNFQTFPVWNTMKIILWWYILYSSIAVVLVIIYIISYIYIHIHIYINIVCVECVGYAIYIYTYW